MMSKKFLLRLAYLVGGGAITFFFLLIAEVNLDDLRLKIGNLRAVPDPVLQIAGLYTIYPNGQIDGPHCAPQKTRIQQYFQQEELHVTLSNKLGSSLPVISRWSADLMGWLGGVDYAKFSDISDHQSLPNWEGHTLDFSPVQQHNIATSKISTTISEIYKSDPNCEETIQKLARAGDCVAIVSRLTYVSNQKIGYKFGDERVCIIANVPDAVPMYVPSQPRRFTMYMSLAKDWIGLLDRSVNSLDNVKTAP